MHNSLRVLLLLQLLAYNNVILAVSPITLQLKWQHQFQFAGYYAAKDQSYYQQAGLDVTFKEALPGIDPVQEVLAGRADYGVGTSELILRRYQGIPVVVLGVIFQHSPLNLLTLTDSGIDHIHKLVNRKIMIEPSSAELFAYLQQEGISSKAIHLHTHSHRLEDVLTGVVDALSVYSTDEVFLLQQQGHTFHLFTPRMSGIDFYGDNLFTLEQNITRQPEQVAAFRAASIRGWQYAMANPEAMVQLIHQQYTQRHSLEHLRFEARAMQDLMQPQLIEPGYMNAGRWRHIAQTYHSLGMLPDDFDIDAMLYFSDDQAAMEQLRIQLFFTLVSLLLLSLLTLIVWRFYRQARANVHRLDTLFQLAPISLLVVDEQHRIVQWNREAERTFGWTEQEVLGTDVLQLLVPPEIIPHVKNIFVGVHHDRVPLRSENSNLRQDGATILCEWLNTPFRDARDESRYILCMAKDITIFKEIQSRIEYMAHFDHLTDLPNRAMFFDRLSQAISQAKREQEQLALMFLDLNQFKPINDTYGHLVGDELLKQAAQRMKRSVRTSDTVGRIGGDEFVVLVPTGIRSIEDAQRVADKIRQALSPPFVIGQWKLVISCSIGIALFPEDGETDVALAHEADTRMYEDKVHQRD